MNSGFLHEQEIEYLFKVNLKYSQKVQEEANNHIISLESRFTYSYFLEEKHNKYYQYTYI